MDIEEIQLLVRLLCPLVYLDRTSSEDENLTVLDYLSSSPDSQPENTAEISTNQDYLMSLLAQLDDEDRAFIILRFGLADGKERNKKEMVSSMRRTINQDEVEKRTMSILEKLRSLGDIDKTNLE